jgi:tetratricopeptide (TPR) repeat protein
MRNEGLTLVVVLLSSRGLAWQEPVGTDTNTNRHSPATAGRQQVSSQPGTDAYSRAVPILKRRIDSLEADPRSSRADLSEAWRGLAYAYFFQRLYSNAEHAYTKALEWQLECVPPDLIQVARLNSSLGSVYQAEHRLSAARQAFQRALASLTGATPDPLVRATLLNNIGALERALGRHVEAERADREAIASLNSVKEPDAVTMVDLLNNLAIECIHRRDYTEALSLLSKALPIIESPEAMFPSFDAEMLLRHYALRLEKTGQTKAAVEMRNKARQLRSESPGNSLLVDVSQLHGERK